LPRLVSPETCCYRGRKVTSREHSLSEFQGLAPGYLFVDFLKNVQYPIVKYSDKLSNLIEEGENESKGEITLGPCVSVINTAVSWFGPRR
jgi:hypothetical protein